MGVARDDLVEGMYVFKRAYLAGRQGGATALHRHRGKVLEWNRGAATIVFDDGRREMVPFNQIEPDDDWLSEYQKKQDAKRARIAQERELSLVPTSPPKPSLTYNLAEKLAADDDEEAEDEPAEETIAQRRQREEAQRAIQALSTPTPAPAVAIAPPESAPPDEDEKSTPGQRKYTALNPDERAELARAVNAGELTRPEAAEMYGVSISTVANIMRADAMGPPEAPRAPRGIGRSFEEREELVRKVDALMAAPHHYALAVACARVGVAPSSYQRWARDLESSAATIRSHRKVHAPETLQKAVGKAITEGHLSTRAAEERFGMRMTTAQKYARDYAAGMYKNVKDVPLDPPAPPPPPPVAELEPPPPPRAPMFAEVAPSSAAQVVITQLTSENKSLRDESARLRAKIKQLLPLIFDGE